ncbi:MAG TPA: filamentous hemagglutinin N-terminal domain-containing protein [Candidatus Saccharimonadales bacterium]|nr:filamentous hemagglutinin N-terminal domain-containing protein [Candidatus Saccharimonadales bacterium]
MIGVFAVKKVFSQFCNLTWTGLLLLVWGGNALNLHANPTGGVVSQGTATFSTSGSQFTVNQTCPYAFVNWQTFNIAAGETTTFNQPSSTSVTWNYISDPNASSINGDLNANGYVILQNPNGFTVGGSATISAHGLVMTTASTPALNLSSGGPWSFNTPPPTAKIINYGQINISGGGSAFLIANDIENNGTISAPGGKIGLYAGQTVLVSTSPDGRGLSAQATVPQGLVDNSGNLVADAGNIALQAQMVNQSGLIQANSAKNVNGSIELVAGDSMNLGGSSIISAHGDTQGTSSGGSVTIQSGNSFSDQAGSAINISGGIQGGDGGQAEISAPQMGAINSIINGQAMDGFSGGILTIDPANIWLASANSDPKAPSGYSIVNVNSFNGLSQINLQADNNITLNTIWTLADQTIPASLSLSAGNNITLNDSSDIQAGNNWSINLTAGTAYSGTTRPASGNDGIYLNGSAFLQTFNGDINLDAANEVQVGWSGKSAPVGVANSGIGYIDTTGGGSINVTTQYGDVNSGSSTAGYNYLTTAPYYAPYLNVGGISTATGGNVTINAGGNVVSFPTTTVAAGDPGTGAFNPTAPGSVTITAGGSVYGHFVEADGTGTINAGQNIGTALQNVALSLVNGGWNLNAQDNIYLQEVRNPNGVFDNLTTSVNRRSVPTPGNHLFDYNPQAWVTLAAGNAVNLTGFDLPRPNDAVPMLLPPTLNINAGPGGVTLQLPTAINSSGNLLTLSDYDITLFPSPYGNLEITTTDGGSLIGGTGVVLLMSDSGLTQWYNTQSGGSGLQPFGPLDHASVPVELNNDTPVGLDISGNMENLILQVSKAANINVDGDMTGCSFYGENLQASGPASVTSITVGGKIENPGSFTSVTLDQGFAALPSADTPPVNEVPPGTSLSSWYLALALAVNPNSPVFSQSYSGDTPSQLINILSGAVAFPGLDFSSLVYNSDTKTLTAIGQLTSDLLTALQSSTLTVVRYGPNGPLLDANGHFETDTISWVPGGSANASLISSLYTESQGAVALNVASGAYDVGGMGQFNVAAGAINLGNSKGILSVGNADSTLSSAYNYSFLTPYMTSGSGASINITTATLEMPSSTIAALAGGDITVTCNGIIPDSPVNNNGVGVSMDLGSTELADFEGTIMQANKLGLGIFTTGGGNVNVTALGTIDIDTSRIAAFNGGNVSVTSETGDVDAGSGAVASQKLAVPVVVFSPYAAPFGEQVYANGIAAETLINPSKVPGAATSPGNITVWTPQGDIIADLGGIKQEALNGTAPAGPTVTLTAGTPAVPGDFSSPEPPLYVGNITLGTVGVIGETVVAQATGAITGLAVSKHNATLTSQTIGGLTVVAGGTANVSVQSAGGSGQGITIIGGAGVNASGVGAGATLLGQNVSVNGATSTSTLGTSATATGASQSAAGQTSSQTQQQVASNDNGNDDEEKKKKKTELVRSVKRVTVILPKAS